MLPVDALTSRRPGVGRAATALAGVLLLASSALFANEPPRRQAVEISLSDVKLLNQDGRSLRLKSEVVGDKIVVMDFIYTTCTTVCPVMSAVFAKLQDRLGARLGEEVELLSITLDPVRDSPARLKSYATRYGARTGWTWLTGEPGTVRAALSGLGAYASDVSQHPSMVVVGDARSGRWMRLFGFPDPEQILAKVDELVRARAAEARTKE